MTADRIPADGQHAKLSASSAYRWFPCPGSIREIAKLETLPAPSYYAVEGTVAHDIASRYLKGELTRAQLEAMRGTKVVHPELPNEPISVDDEMIDHVLGYAALVHAELAKHPGAELKIEHRVYPLADRPDLYGTSDALIIEPFGTIEVIDLKYGQGYVVEVERNDQLQYYGAGSLREGGEDPLNFERVELVIYQPRAYHPDGDTRRWEITPVDLLEWVELLRKEATETEDPNAPLVPGDHCRFCPVETTCPALAAMIEAETGAIFDGSPLDPVPNALRVPDADDTAALARAMMFAPLLESWLKAMYARAYEAQMGGAKIPLHKLVRGREGNREWVDEKRATAAIVKLIEENAQGSVESIHTAPKLKSPAQLVKIVRAVTGWTAKASQEWIDTYVTRSEGRLTLVHESDPRPEVELAVIDFPDDLPALPAGEEDLDEWLS